MTLKVELTASPTFLAVNVSSYSSGSSPEKQKQVNFIEKNKVAFQSQFKSYIKDLYKKKHEQLKKNHELVCNNNITLLRLSHQDRLRWKMKKRTVLILKGNSYCRIKRSAKGLELKSHPNTIIRNWHTNMVTYFNTNRARQCFTRLCKDSWPNQYANNNWQKKNDLLFLESAKQNLHIFTCNNFLVVQEIRYKKKIRYYFIVWINRFFFLYCLVYNCPISYAIQM